MTNLIGKFSIIEITQYIDRVDVQASQTVQPKLATVFFFSSKFDNKHHHQHYQIIIIINMCRPHKLSTPSLPEWEVREKRQTGVTVTKWFNIFKRHTFEYFETVRNG